MGVKAVIPLKVITEFKVAELVIDALAEFNDVKLPTKEEIDVGEYICFCTIKPPFIVLAAVKLVVFTSSNEVVLRVFNAVLALTVKELLKDTALVTVSPFCTVRLPCIDVLPVIIASDVQLKIFLTRSVL